MSFNYSYLYIHGINVELANLCAVPQYPVYRGIQDLHPLMKTLRKVHPITGHEDPEGE
jgi:hypothetical protein